MSSDVTKLLGKQVNVQITGNNFFNGVLTDLGPDIFVLYNGHQFLYIPLLHIHSIKFNSNTEEHVTLPGEVSIAVDKESISYRQALTNAKGVYTEISVIGNSSFHGYVTDVLSDYFTFYSPVYKTLFISLNHLKWLIPYNQNTSPYTLRNLKLPVNPPNDPLLQSLEEQLKKETGKLVVFDGGVDPLKIGLLKKVENNLAELSIASRETVYINIDHIKSVQLP